MTRSNPDRPYSAEPRNTSGIITSSPHTTPAEGLDVAAQNPSDLARPSAALSGQVVTREQLAEVMGLVDVDGLEWWIAAILRFVMTWANLEQSGDVDSLGGQQFRRVLSEFVREVAPPWNPIEFIREHRLDTPPTNPHEG